MVQDAQDGTAGAVARLFERAAIGVALGALLLLGLGLVAELLRRRRRAGRFVAVLDRTVPLHVRVVVVSLVTVVSALTGARPAGSADTVQGWLGRAPTSTTSAPVTTSTTFPIPETTLPPVTTTTLPPPVVLEPPITLESLDPAPDRVAAPAPPPTPTTPAVPASPAAASPSGSTYVVVRGDCLWSIAERLLGPGVDARAIDAGWRTIYAANRAAIGDDPNLIHIGLTLQLPPLHAQP